MDDKDKKPEESKPVIKSWNDLKKEAKAQAKEKYAKKLEAKEGKKDEPINETPKVDTDPATEVENTPEVVEKKPEEPKVDVDAVARKAADEAASKVAEATKAEFQAKIDQILNKDKDIQEKQKEADELIASWDKEQRLPKDYKELIDETMRIADAKMAHKQRELEAKAKEEKPPEAPKTESPTEDRQQQDFLKEITADIQDLMDAKVLPKPANFDEINNPATTDPAAKEIQKVFDFGIKLNSERVKQGLAPIKSFNKIYFIHYKPVMDKVAPKNSQPAGANAPTSPSKAQNTESSAPQPFYQKSEDGKYHPKSWAQIKYEALRAKMGR